MTDEPHELHRRLEPGPAKSPGSQTRALPSDGSEHAPPPAPHGLPLAVSSFVGRQRELGELATLLPTCRVVTLTGSTGIGKTRLALELARLVSRDYTEGAWLVELAAVGDPALVPMALASALAIREQPGRPLTDAVIDHLRQRNVLLVLDNCEQVVAACAAIAESLLQACPGLSILATSQEALAISGEHSWSVSPLSVPQPLEAEDPEALVKFEAVRLFCERAAAIDSGFVLTAEIAPAVAEIARRLDGIALAIELAAARVAVLNPLEIAARLDDRFNLLSGGSRTLLPRHQTLLDAVQWSHDLLSAPERLLLRRLTVFAGGAPLDAIDEVCTGEGLGTTNVLDLLTALVSKSLVIADTTGVQTRYRLLETIRQYGRDRLVESGEAVDVLGRHLDWYVRLAEQAEPELTGPNQRRWLERLHLEHDNLRAAFGWAMTADRVEGALRIAGALTLFWRIRGHFSEGRQWLEAVLRRSEGIPESLRAKALWGAGFLAVMVGDSATAGPLLDESLHLMRAFGDRSGEARSLLLLANRRQFSEGPALAVPLLRQSVTLAREVDDRWCLAHGLALLASALIAQGEAGQAWPLLEEALAVARQAQDNQSLRIALIVLGSLALTQGELDLAEILLMEALTVVRELGERYGNAVALSTLGELALSRGDHERARSLLVEGVGMARASGNPIIVALSLCSLGRLARAQDKCEEARALFEEALSVGRNAGSTSIPALKGLGDIELGKANLESAKQLFDRALRVAEEGGDKLERARVLHGLAEVARAQGDREEAASLHHLALEIRGEMGATLEALESVESVATLAIALGRYDRGARLMGAAQRGRDGRGIALSATDRARHDAALAELAEQLASHELAAAWAEGAALSLDEAVAYASRGRGAHSRATSGWASLTRAERSIVSLVAEGLTNREIAARLFVSIGTVKTHMTHVFAKLGVLDRRDLARMARDRDPPITDRRDVNLKRARR